MPMRQPNQEGYPGRRQPKLETYEEEEEDDDDVFEDNIMMGLPPKDIPCRTMSNSDENIPSLNMDDIPFTDVHGGANLPGQEEEEGEDEVDYVAPVLSRRGSNPQERVSSLRKESAGDDRVNALRHGQKTKRTQVRQELANYYERDTPSSGGRHTSRDGRHASRDSRHASGDDRRGSS